MVNITRLRVLLNIGFPNSLQRRYLQNSRESDTGPAGWGVVVYVLTIISYQGHTASDYN